MSSNTAVFIIDDNPLFSSAIKKEVELLFENKSYDVLTFSDGESALNMLHLEPRLIVVDYHLDGKKKDAKNGIEVIESIRSRNPKTDFIMITADEHIELFFKSQKLNIYDYITKGPITPYKLGLSITSWLKLQEK